MINKKDIQRSIIISAILFVVFLIYTDLLCLFDLQAIGPDNTKVGFASLNKIFLKQLNNGYIYGNISNYFLVLCVFVMIAFAVTGFIQLVKSRKLSEVESGIIALAFTYAVMIFFYIVFEFIVINYRPVLVDYELEASYPSSHTMLAACVIGSGIAEFKRLFKNKKTLNITVTICGIIFILLMAAFRMAAALHWFTDIIGSFMISVFLVYFWHTVTIIIDRKRQKKTR